MLFGRSKTQYSTLCGSRARLCLRARAARARVCRVLPASQHPSAPSAEITRTVRSTVYRFRCRDRNRYRCRYRSRSRSRSRFRDRYRWWWCGGPPVPGPVPGPVPVRYRSRTGTGVGRYRNSYSYRLNSTSHHLTLPEHGRTTHVQGAFHHTILRTSTWLNVELRIPCRCSSTSTFRV